MTLALHLLYLSRDLGSDEGGFAMVARGWRSAGPYLYGQQWVDRPPGLLVVFAAADRLGPVGVRLMAGVCATVLVAAAAWAAAVVAGRRGAGWSALTAFAFATSPLLGAYQLNGEIIAAPLVMVSIAAVLHAVHRSTGALKRGFLAVVAGSAAAAAVLVKQDFAEGLVFAGVLLVGGPVVARFPTRRAVATGAALLVGATAWIVATGAWAASRVGIPALVYATYGFRADANDVLARWSWHAPEVRLLQLAGLASVSGMLFLAVQIPLGQRHRGAVRSPLAWAVTATAALGVFAVGLGGSYWPHYLIELVPVLALAAGIACVTGASGQRWTRRLVSSAAAVTVLTAPVAVVALHLDRSQSLTVADWLASSAHRHDTVVVPFTHANVIGESGLTSPYPYSWSLPTRTLDPHLRLLTATLDASASPTWVVRWDAPDTWGLDPGDRIGRALHAHYREVAVVCGHPVWLHRGVSRTIAAAPEGCGTSFAVTYPSGTQTPDAGGSRAQPPH
jgi:hypothetical protein